MTSGEPRAAGRALKGWLWMTLGLLALVLGAVWTLQGLSVLDGSVMSGVRIWAVVGPVVAAVGLILIVVGVMIRGRAKRVQAPPPAADH
jgi:hypothetical protein